MSLLKKVMHYVSRRTSRFRSEKDTTRELSVNVRAIRDALKSLPTDQRNAVSKALSVVVGEEIPTTEDVRKFHKSTIIVSEDGTKMMTLGYGRQTTVLLSDGEKDTLSSFDETIRYATDEEVVQFLETLGEGALADEFEWIQDIEVAETANA